MVSNKPRKPAKSSKKAPQRKLIRARLRLGSISLHDLAFLEDYGNGGIKMALAHGSIKTAGAGYSKIKRYKLQRKKALEFKTQTDNLMNKYPRIKRSWTIVE